MLKAQIEADLKAAMLGGEKKRVEVLRGLKSAILYEEVAQNARETGLSDDAILKVIARESKKRAEASELYKKSGSAERADAELLEKKIIDVYLPSQLSDDELGKIIEEVIANLGKNAQMGAVIGAVRAKVGVAADGSRIAATVQGRLRG
ncbi:MAG: GatB/YqeY domain-containing protein [Candidatus Woesebacteria bacterium]|jgi:uncharacterized protein YqeY